MGDGALDVHTLIFVEVVVCILMMLNFGQKKGMICLTHHGNGLIHNSAGCACEGVLGMLADFGEQVRFDIGIATTNRQKSDARSDFQRGRAAESGVEWNVAVEKYIAPGKFDSVFDKPGRHTATIISPGMLPGNNR